MLTPRFSVSQSEEFIDISIAVPYCDIDSLDYHIDGRDFTFYSSPYHLRLRFSGSLVDNDRVTSSYQSDVNNLVLKFPKLNRGEFFKNLDMVTSLIPPIVAAGPLHNKAANCDDKSEQNSQLNGGYGFNRQHVGVSSKVSCVLGDVLHVDSPDEKTNQQIRNERIAAELRAFDDDHYLADLLEDEDCKALEELDVYSVYGDDSFSSEQQDILLRMKNISNVNDIDKHGSLLMLAELLFGFCYDHRVSAGEMSVESGWNISTLSACLSWLEYPCDLRITVVACLRRSLCYPFYRNWRLSQRVLRDVSWLLAAGKRRVVKCLLHVHQAFVVADPRYLFNQLYVDDMIVWLQNADAAVLDELVEQLATVNVTKADLDLDLDELERAGFLVARESQNEGDIVNRLAAVDLDSDDDGEESSTDLSSSESSSSDSSSDLNSGSSTSSDEDCD